MTARKFKIAYVTHILFLVDSAGLSQSWWSYSFTSEGYRMVCACNATMTSENGEGGLTARLLAGFPLSSDGTYTKQRETFLFLPWLLTSQCAPKNNHSHFGTLRIAGLRRYIRVERQKNCVLDGHNGASEPTEILC